MEWATTEEDHLMEYPQASMTPIPPPWAPHLLPPLTSPMPPPWGQDMISMSTLEMEEDHLVESPLAKPR